MNRAKKRREMKGKKKRGLGPQPRYTDDQFKFIGPEKRELTRPQMTLRNRRKRVRQQLRSL